MFHFFQTLREFSSSQDMKSGIDVEGLVQYSKVLSMGLPIMEILADIRKVFLAYLEAPNSILMKNKKNDRILLNCPHYPY